MLALPRGGVPVAYEVARALRPLDVFLVRKLGAPGHEELAMGAIASGDVVVMNDEVVKAMKVQADDILDAIASERSELARREAAYRDGPAAGGRPRPDRHPHRRRPGYRLDDARRGEGPAAPGPARIVVAVPIGASSTCAELQRSPTSASAPSPPSPSAPSGSGTRTSPRPRTMRSPSCSPAPGGPARPATGRPGARPHRNGHRHGGPLMNDPGDSTVDEQEVAIPAGGRTIRGTLSRPRGAAAVVVFAHGSGSGRYSPRNQYVAQVLQEAGLATLLLDLLEEDEANDRSKVFDIGLLADRLQAAADWLGGRPETAGLRLGYFGASTGAGGRAAGGGRAPESVGAVVSRGGRPDLAGDALPRVTAPTLLIVGGGDEIVLELNRQAFDQLTGVGQIDIVPGATHLFAEPGALEEVARLARGVVPPSI